MLRIGVLGAALLGCALLAQTAEAHPPVGVRVAVGSARVAVRATRAAAYVPVRTAAVATRVTYRAATNPLYYPHAHYVSPVRVAPYYPYSAAYPAYPTTYPVYRPVVSYGYYPY